MEPHFSHLKKVWVIARRGFFASSDVSVQVFRSVQSLSHVRLFVTP